MAKLLWTRTTVSQAFRPYEEFLQMQAEIEDYGDLRDVTASAHAEPTRSLDDALKDIEN